MKTVEIEIVGKQPIAKAPSTVLKPVEKIAQVLDRAVEDVARSTAPIAKATPIVLPLLPAPTVMPVVVPTPIPPMAPIDKSAPAPITIFAPPPAPAPTPVAPPALIPLPAPAPYVEDRRPSGTVAYESSAVPADAVTVTPVAASALAPSAGAGRGAAFAVGGAAAGFFAVGPIGGILGGVVGYLLGARSGKST